MDYKLYTLVDISNTGQYRIEPGKELDRLQEQNFNTLLQTIGIRANITYQNKPSIVEAGGRVFGFDTDEIIRVWRFDFSTERDDLFLLNDDPVGYLKEDFHLVPYISSLDELMEQKYAVFNVHPPGNNIIFYKK